MTLYLAQAFSHGAGSRFLAFLVEPALRSLLVGGVAALLLAALRVRRVTVRLCIWTAVLCVALAMPLLGIVLPRMPFAVPASGMEKISQRVPILKTVASGEWLVANERQKASGQCAVVSAGQAKDYSASGADACRASAYVCHSEVAALGFTKAKHGGDTVRRVAVRTRPVAYAIRGSKLDPSPLTAGHGMTSKSQDAVTPEVMPVMPLKIIPIVGVHSAISPAQMAAEIALVIYLLVALALFARLVVGVWFSRKLARAAREISPQYFTAADDFENQREREALRLLRFRSCASGLALVPQVKESDAISVPATVGVRRAAILLPAEWRAWSEEQLDAVLAHEISHVARRDSLTQTLSLVHRAIFWFSPLAWWLDRQLTELAEEASDEAALAGGADRARYAETLLGFFVQLRAARGRVWWQGVSMAKKSRASSAERRVDRILAWKGTASLKKPLAIALVAFAVPVIFFAASLHPVIAYGQDAKNSGQESVPIGQQAGSNVITPGGPKAPALPKAPKGGVSAPAPQRGIPTAPALSAGVAAPAIAPAPGTPVAPATPAPGQGIASPGPMPPAPHADVVAPREAPPLNPTLAPTGPRTIHPSTRAGVALVAPIASSASVVSTAPTAPMDAAAGQSTTIVVGDTDPREAEAKLRAALKALGNVDAQSAAARDTQLRAAMNELRDAQEASAETDSAQLHAAQRALEKAQRMMQQNDAAQLQEAREAMEEARRDLEDASAQQEDAIARQQEAKARQEDARAQEEARPDAQEAARAARNYRFGYGYWGDGQRYVIMSGENEGVEMSGDDEDFHHAQELRKKLGKDLIWFERDEKSYVITDPAFIAKARALWAPEEALAKQQDEFGRQQDELGKQQDALGEQMDKVSVKPPDITADLQRIQERLKELQVSGATQTELGEIQSKLGELQSRVGRVQSEAGVQQSAIGRQQGELGRKQGELGRKQGELGRRQGEIAREASRQLRTMFDDAIAKGIAKPE